MPNAQQLWMGIQNEEIARKMLMPTERSALERMFSGYQRLLDLGWKNIIYCPKDGSMFDAIEAGSTGIHRCNYQGKWPEGGWWVYDENGPAPSHPILFKSKPTEGK